ncbi:DUF2779 domain-containing protein [Carboxylicivirga sp. N1Y90]|uniref:DUF2779 domain-containing protein n=1 Tax=Carboxylicivirga fragile TaxID=3417571 RepID=UPI003D3554CF|nr:DUF2779 domain-containing protein [Marinilabiliaceae bacterium N1Y90]
MPRYLTKSRFALALACPTKLYYSGKDQYPDQNTENDFLAALAKGGFQVGALAKCYYPNGHDIDALDYEEAIKRTNDLLQQENVVIFEAAFRVDNLFIRVDVLEKIGNQINLIEVKSKSFSGNSSLDMLNKSGYLDSGWKKYIYDVAFQKHVVTKAEPDWDVKAYLMLADKDTVATVDGLNQKFLLKENSNGRTYVEIVGNPTPEELGEEILVRVNVDDLCQMIYDGTDSKTLPEKSFIDLVKYLADHYSQDKKIITPIHTGCASCEFKTEEETDGKFSGFKECWSHQLHWKHQDFDKPLIFDIWNFRGKQKLMDNGIYHMDQVTVDDIGSGAENQEDILTPKARQWLQVQQTVSLDPQPYIDLDGLREEMDSWVYPLHMIDFETSAVAVPFYKGRRPYEQTAFQFSHHIIYEDGRIEHKGQYLNIYRGVFPNFEFVRMLKAELSEDEGSVFRYAAHENTILNHIMIQLQEANNDDVNDKEELIEFIKTITHSANHRGTRDMIDLLELVKSYYWHPLMKGSNSIKAVLPAIMNSSEYLKERYIQPIYGLNSEVKSLNFKDGWKWIQLDDQGKVISPYKLLPSLFDGLDDDQIEAYLMGDKLADGGAAMTAYAMMQFSEMSQEEHQRIADGLLRYCELDTMAMVFIYEGWKEMII